MSFTTRAGIGTAATAASMRRVSGMTRASDILPLRHYAQLIDMFSWVRISLAVQPHGLDDCT